MILTPEILTIYILDALFVFFAFIAFVQSLQILKNYNADESTQLQYDLEKKSYLAATIIKFIFLIKIPLFIFFIFSVDKISIILPGAMCGAGVVNASDYGIYLLLFKVINLYFFAYWIVLDTEDMKSKTQPYIRIKFLLFSLAFFLLLFEIFLEVMMFSSIDIQNVVDCCGAIFSTTDASYMAAVLNLSTPTLLASFYGVYLLILAAFSMKNRYLFSISNLLFVIVSLLTLIAFFGTYIYELPTHHCPFCFLQQDYSYVGYFLYLFLFIGTFYGLIIGLIEFEKKQQNSYFNKSLLFNTLYLLIVSAYPIIYFIKNGVWL